MTGLKVKGICWDSKMTIMQKKHDALASNLLQ